MNYFTDFDVTFRVNSIFHPFKNIFFGILDIEDQKYYKNPGIIALIIALLLLLLL